jgi:3-dehydroquinate dehydratase II
LPLIRIGQGFTLSLDVLERVDRMAAILVLNGPNLNLLGSREPGHYGRTTLAEIQQDLEESARSLGCTLECLQSNAEHVLIEAVHRAPEQGVRFIILNPAAFTHTSVALRDALLAVGIPFIEVHLSNVHAREPFRAHSYFSDIAIGVISGLGAEGYLFALRAAAGRLAPDHSNENH